MFSDLSTILVISCQNHRQISSYVLILNPINYTLKPLKFLHPSPPEKLLLNPKLL